jgi:hypothetical protein
MSEKIKYTPQYRPRCPYCEEIVTSYTHQFHYSQCKSASHFVKYFCYRYQINTASEHIKNAMLRSLWNNFIERTLRGPKPNKIYKVTTNHENQLLQSAVNSQKKKIKEFSTDFSPILCGV